MNKDQWDAMGPLPVALDWKQVQFRTDIDLENIPDKPGIYSFSIVAEKVGLPPNGYIAYVGIAGEKGLGKRHLRQRYRDYIREKRTVVRSHIHRLLDQWDGSLVFHYAEVQKFDELPGIEKILINTLLPPGNKRDFDVVIKQFKGAAW